MSGSCTDGSSRGMGSHNRDPTVLKVEEHDDPRSEQHPDQRNRRPREQPAAHQQECQDRHGEEERRRIRVAQMLEDEDDLGQRRVTFN
jgi:hypothetical protein